MNESKKLKELAKAQAQFDYLADRYIDGYCIEDVNYEMKKHLQSFLDYGFDINIILQCLAPDDVYRNYDLLVSHGARIDTKRLVKRLSDDFIWENLEELLDEGFDVGTLLNGRRCSTKNLKYLQKFLSNHGDKFLTNLATVPDAISVDTLIENIPMRDVITASRYIGLEKFMDDFECAGGDINRLSERFVKEVGYTGRYEDVIALAQIIRHGGLGGVSMEKFVRSIDKSILDEDDKTFIKRILETYASPTVLEAFRS